jgi:hypothetical protein
MSPIVTDCRDHFAEPCSVLERSRSILVGGARGYIHKDLCATHWDHEAAVGGACGIVIIHRGAGGDSHGTSALVDAVMASGERSHSCSLGTY